MSRMAVSGLFAVILSKELYTLLCQRESPDSIGIITIDSGCRTTYLNFVSTAFTVFAALVFEQDYIRYSDNLREAAERNQVAIHAYKLMANHVHLLVTPGYGHGVSPMMQDTGRKYVRYINTRYKRSGPLWDGRF